MTDRFFFWRSWYDALALMGTEDAHALVMALCAYAFDGEVLDLEDRPNVKAVWTSIKDQARDSVLNGRESSANGARGGRPRKSEKGSLKGGQKGTPKAKGTERKGKESVPVPGTDGASLGSLSSDPLAPGERPTYAEYIRQLGGEGQ